ncbi:hypothetical protein GCM10027348_20530 [Hymenobacter tenuis]
MVVRAAKPTTEARKWPVLAARKPPAIILANASGNVRGRNAESQALAVLGGVAGAAEEDAIGGKLK